MELKNRRVVLTGASGGIGSAIARSLAEQGASLILCGRREAALQGLAGTLPAAGHAWLAADLSTGEGRTALLEKAGEFSADMLINALGANQLSVLEAMDDQDIERIIATNLTVPVQICKDMLPLFKQRPDAAIVNIGSILGSIGYAGSSVYCASKFGLRGFTESLRRELADSAVQVIYFAPRATDTELNDEAMQGLNRALGNAVDCPDLVARELVKTLQKRGASDRYLGWPEALFVRLNGLVPGLIDNALLKQLPVIRQYANKSMAHR